MTKLLFIICLFLASTSICHAGVSVVGELVQHAVAAPGERYQGAITVKNNGKTAAEVKISQRDYLFFADGRNDFGAPGSHPRSNAGWMSVTPARLTLPPEGTASFHYAIRVPKQEGAPLSGSYWSVLLVEPQEPLPETQPPSGKVAVALRTMVRYAVQVVTDIGESGASKITFTNQRLLANDGLKLLQLDIENVGERWLAPLVWVDLYDAAGEPVGHFEGSKQRIYPGCSVRHRLDLTRVPPGKYSALAIADNGDDHVFGGQYELVIK